MAEISAGHGVAAGSVGSGIVWSLFLTVLPLGLAAAITPTLFALQVLVVSGPKWKARANAVAVGTGATFAILFALVLFGMSQLPDAGTGVSTSTEYWIELVCGLVLVPTAIWLIRPHPRADAALEKKVEGYANHASPWIFAGLAAYMTVTDFSSLVLVVPALHDVTSSSVEVIGKALVVLFLLGCVMLPVWSPPLAVKVLGQAGVRLLHKVYAVLMGHQVEVMGAVAGIVGVVLAWRGFQGLRG